MPLITVIVPNYNHAPYLKQRIDSILNQSFQDFELILLDDCSTDNSREVLSAYAGNEHVSHIVFNEQNSGSTFQQWDKGIKLSKGEFIWIAESDDYAAPDFLQKTIPFLKKDAHVSLVYTGSFMVNEKSEPIDKDWDKYPKSVPPVSVFKPNEYLLKKMLWKGSVYNASMVVFRKSCYYRIQPDFTSYRYCGDWLFFSEIGRQGTVISINQKLNYFRQHTNKVSPRAEKEGLYFIEGGKVRRHIMDVLQLTSTQRFVVQGKFWLQLGRMNKKYPGLKERVLSTVPEFFHHKYTSILAYETNKFVPFSGLRKGVI